MSKVILSVQICLSRPALLADLQALAAAFTGYTPEELNDFPFLLTTLAGQEDKNTVQDLYNMLKGGEIPVRPQQIRWKHKDGHEAWSRIWFLPLQGGLSCQEGPVTLPLSAGDLPQQLLAGELEMRNRELELINQVAYSDEATLTVRDFLSLALELLLSFSSAREGAIYLLEGNQVVQISASSNYKEEETGAIISDCLQTAAEEPLLFTGEIKKTLQGRRGGPEQEPRDRWLFIPLKEFNLFAGFCLLTGDADCFAVQPEEQLLKAAGTAIGQVLYRKKLAEALRLSEERYRDIIDSMEEGYYEIDLKGCLTFVNDSFCAITGYPRRELIQSKLLQYCSAPHQLQKNWEEVLAAKEARSGVLCQIKHINGTLLLLELSLTPVCDGSGQLTGLRGIARDITERTKAEEKLRYLSSHDHLTGLYNRAFFEQEMRRLQLSQNYPTSILICDVDGLKIINDTLGHSKGDDLLKAAARLISKPLRSSDIVARMGGDEFAVLLPLTPEPAAHKARRRVQEQVKEHNNSGSGLPLYLSIGTATTINPQQPLDEIYRSADNDMYKDKLNRKSEVYKNLASSFIKLAYEKGFIQEINKDCTCPLCDLAVKLGQAANLKQEILEQLILLAQVHNIGKIGMESTALGSGGYPPADSPALEGYPSADSPAEERFTLADSPALKSAASMDPTNTGIFTPPGLQVENNVEPDENKRHSEIGYRLALASPELMPVAELILQHHEQWDGQGYPRGLKGEEIHPACRILAVARAYLELTGTVEDELKPVGRHLAPKEALQEINKMKGKELDPFIVELLIQQKN